MDMLLVRYFRETDYEQKLIEGSDALHGKDSVSISTLLVSWFVKDTLRDKWFESNGRNWAKDNTFVTCVHAHTAEHRKIFLWLHNIEFFCFSTLRYSKVLVGLPTLQVYCEPNRLLYAISRLFLFLGGTWKQFPVEDAPVLMTAPTNILLMSLASFSVTCWDFYTSHIFAHFHFDYQLCGFIVLVPSNTLADLHIVENYDVV